MRKKEVFNISLSAIMIALSVGLDLIFNSIPFLRFPYGGCVSLSMLPLVIVSISCGGGYGLGAGIIFGIINYFIDGYGFNIVSILLDYLLGFASLSVIAIFNKQIKAGSKKYFLIGFGLGCVLRWLCSGLSGILNMEAFGITSDFLESIFGTGKAGMGYAFIYSFILYNLPYILASYILCSVVGIALQNKISILNFTNYNQLK